ncbi:MAG: chemotaxis response regulator protein-glutamate methylesterase [Deltaproteobacteria bacterium]|nr:chemotaxis response regulator protein-glutamate methylesterase [Deltaproteobacteria bacterium]
MIKVLIVDDSAFMTAAVRHILSSDAGIEVVGTASDGMDAIGKVKRLKPDVVLLDIEMPLMDGLTALSYIMAETPAPVVMLSGLEEKNASLAVKSLEHGAVDFIRKPSGTISYDIGRIRDEIVEKVRIAATVDVRKMALELPEESYRLERLRTATRKSIVVIGASTGGPRALGKVLSGLRRGVSAAVFVVQHMSIEFTASFAERLRWVCPLDISIARDGETVAPGKVFIAAGDSNTAIERGGDGKAVVVTSVVHATYPSIDHTMESAARVYGKEALGVLMTGAGSDGALGMKAIKKAGGATIAEDSSTCVVYGMPRAAIEMGVVDEVVPLHGIAEAIMRMV